MAEPAGERLPQPGQMPRRDIDEGRRAGAAIEVFVAAADGEIGVAAVEVDRQRAGAVARGPRSSARPRHGPGGHAAMSSRAAGAVVDIGEHQHGERRRRSPRRSLGGDLPQLVAIAEQIGEAVGDVEVGREIAGLGQDDLALRPQMAAPRRAP